MIGPLSNLPIERRREIARNAANAQWEQKRAAGFRPKGRNPESVKRAARAFFERNRNNPEFKAKRIAWNKAWRKANPDAGQQLSYRYSRLKGKAKYRGMEMALTLEQYSALVIDKGCYYCGTPLTHGISLDRVDSTKGYTADNVRPCCYQCNVMKMDFTDEQFQDRLERILAHLRKREYE